MAEINEKVINSERVGLWAFILLGFVWASVSTCYLLKDIKYFYVLWLLIIPIFFQSPVLLRKKYPLKLKKFYSQLSFLSIGSYLIAMIFYRFNIFLSNITTFIWILLAFLLVGVSFLVTYRIMREWRAPTRNHKSNASLNTILSKVPPDVGDYPFEAICFFLSIFLCIAYLLAFSFAFHDTYEREFNPGGVGALYAKTFDNTITRQHSSKAEKDNMLQKIRKILFNEASAVVEVHEDLEIEPSKIRKRCYNNLGYAEIPDRASSEKEFQTEMKARRIEHNHKSLREITKSIEDMTADKGYERIRITLLGHSNDKGIEKVRTTYKSNLELSEARTRQVHLLLANNLDSYRRLLKKSGKSSSLQGNKNRLYNIEWLLSSISNEAKFLCGEIPKEVPENKKYVKLDKWCSVEVSVTHIPEHPSQLHMEVLKTQSRVLELLDYVYFTIYTITTTGYGDIIPITSIAKFIASIANMFEIFFIVIFFNVLVSSVMKPKLEGTTRPNAEVPPVKPPETEAAMIQKRPKTKRIPPVRQRR